MVCFSLPGSDSCPINKMIAYVRQNNPQHNHYRHNRKYYFLLFVHLFVYPLLSSIFFCKSKIWNLQFFNITFVCIQPFPIVRLIALHIFKKFLILYNLFSIIIDRHLTGNININIIDFTGRFPRYAEFMETFS